MDTYVALGLAPTEFVPRYLSDCSNREGTRLLTACRLGSLQLMGKIARFMNWPAIGGSCLLCSSGETENVEHFVLRCTALQNARSRCEEGLRLALPQLGVPGATLWARYQTPEGRFGLLLGNSPKVLKEQQVDTAVHAEDWARACWVMDKAAKNLLVAMWRMRDAIMGKVSVQGGRIVHDPPLPRSHKAYQKQIDQAPPVFAAPESQRQRWASWLPKEPRAWNDSLKKGPANFYVVTAGRRPGLYYKWSDCRRAIAGVKGARFQGYQRLTDADRAVNAIAGQPRAASSCIGT